MSKVAGGFATFFIAKALDPGNYGIWLTMTLFVSYSSLLTFGTLETFIKQVPFFKGKGDVQSAKQLESVVFTAMIIVAVLIIVIGFILTMFAIQLQANSLRPEIMVMVVATSLSFPSAYFYYRFVANQNFKAMGLIEAIRAFFNVFLVVGFSFIWGLIGAAVGYLISEIMVCLISGMVSIRSHGLVKLDFDFGAIWNSVLIGFPITIFWWIFMLQGSVDRLVSISLLGTVPTGYYGIGISIVSVLFLLPQSFSRVLYPRINEKLGEAAREEDLYRIIILPTRALYLFLSGVIGVGVMLIPFVYNMLPKYLPGIAAGQILFVVSIFRLTTTNGINFLIATNRQKQLLQFILASLSIGVITSYGTVRLGYGIEGLALSTGFSGLLLSLLVWRLVFAGMGFALSKQWEEIIKLQIPFLMLLMILGFGIFVVPQLLGQTTMLSFIYALIFTVIYGSIIFALPMTRQWTTEIMNMFHRSLEPKPLS